MKKLYSLFALSLLAVPMSAQAPVTYTVEKDIIHSYLTDFDYDTMDIKISLVMDYFDMPHVTDAGKPATAPENRLDAPAPYRITWTHQDGAEAQRVDVAPDTRFERGVISFTVNKDTSVYDLYNMTPGETVYYRVVSVKDDVESTVTSGSLKPEGMLRWIYAEGTWNVRDMGGWTGLGGNPIRYGQIFRGGQLTNPKDPYNVLLTSAGIEAMRNAGIRAELDLRSSSQAHYSYASFAIKENNKYDADFTNIATTSARMWHYDADNSNIKAFQWIINELKAGKPVFYHCQNGADRTGTMGLLIGALLGMSDGDLAKDYELTTFCQEAAVDFDSTEVGFARLRNYEGKKGSVDASSNPKDYMFAPVIDKWNEMSGTTQRKVYNFFKNGVSGSKISTADLIWFIKYMTGYTVVDDITYDGGILITLDKNMQTALNAKVYPEDATNSTITYTSSNPAVATVSDDGVITAWTSGQATITMMADGLAKTVTVNVPKIESIYPSSATIDGQVYGLKAPINNKVSDGSFEYGNYGEWKNCAGTTLSSTGFALKRYVEDQDSVYLESKIDGDETSEGSIRMEWITPKKRTYLLGFRIKNSTNLVTTQNPNLKVMLTTDGAPDDDPNATILGFPSYSGEWTEVQYIISTVSSYNRTRIIFTHLSQNGNNTCLDNFYLVELDTPSGFNAVERIGEQPAWAKAYDINGREVDVNTRGLKIINGKKVLISE